MTEGQLRRARKLIRRLCANYDEGNCLALDEGEGCVCVQSISYSLLCRYFKEAVLPADAELCAAIGQGADELKRCRSCGKPFQARSNRALYCPRCAAFEQRKKTRERVRRHRGQMYRFRGRKAQVFQGISGPVCALPYVFPLTPQNRV